MLGCKLRLSSGVIRRRGIGAYLKMDPKFIWPGWTWTIFFGPESKLSPTWTKITHLSVNEYEVPIAIQHNCNSRFLFSACNNFRVLLQLTRQDVMQHDAAALLAVGGRGCSSASHSVQPYSTDGLSPLPYVNLKSLGWMRASESLCRPTPWLSGQREVVMREKQV